MFNRIGASPVSVNPDGFGTWGYLCEWGCMAYGFPTCGMAEEAFASHDCFPAVI